ncbi:MAG: ABC transporter substrate-binding protein [Actinomycetota bacterium]
MVAVALVAVACGSDATTDDEQDRPAVSAEVAPSDETSAANDATTATSADDIATVGESSIVIEDVSGPVELPITSDGVHALDEWTAVGLLLLGITPSVDGFFEDNVVEELFAAEGLDVGPPGVNLETIAARRPSLLLGIGEPVLIQAESDLEDIAPTAITEYTASWDDQIELLGSITGRGDEAAAVVETIDSRITDLRARLEQEGFAGQEVAVLQVFGSAIFALGPLTPAGTILDRLGFGRTEAQSGDGAFGFITLSEETLPEETDVDVVLGMRSLAFGGDDETIFDNPVVDTDGKIAATVIGDYWFANHALAYWLILDDIEALLLGDGTPSTGTIEEIDAAWQSLRSAVAEVQADGG